MPSNRGTHPSIQAEEKITLVLGVDQKDNDVDSNIVVFTKKIVHKEKKLFLYFTSGSSLCFSLNARTETIILNNI